jgi:hypothetical protein
VRPKASEPYEDERRAAEEALKAAQQMPAGPKRIASLKEAGQMRFDGLREKAGGSKFNGRENERLRRGHPRE